MPILGVSLAVRSIPKNKHSEKVNTWEKKSILFYLFSNLHRWRCSEHGAHGTWGSGRGAVPGLLEGAPQGQGAPVLAAKSLPQSAQAPPCAFISQGAVHASDTPRAGSGNVLFVFRKNEEAKREGFFLSIRNHRTKVKHPPQSSS